MAKKILIVIDMQADFVDGQLPNPAAAKIIPTVVQKIKQTQADGGIVLATRDTHQPDYLDTLEGQKLPVEHCIQGTEGWQLIPEVMELLQDGDWIIDKPTFGSYHLIEALATALTDDDVESIEICGTVTSICVIANAVMIRAAYPNTPIIVDQKAVADISPEMQTAALKVLAAQQIDVI